MRMKLPPLVVVAMATLLAPGVSGQQDPAPLPVFRSSIEAVEVTAFVTDARGTPVTDLAVDEFEIVEDGVPQTVTSFTRVNIPIERLEQPLFTTTEIEPDVRTNQNGEGRLYAFVIDEIPPAQALRVRGFLRTFIEREFGSNDVAALVYLGRGQSRNTQGFTSSRRLLLEAAEKVTGGFLDDTFGISAVTLPPVDGLGPSELDIARDQEESWPVRSRMRSLRELVESLAGITGRQKALLYFTAGLGMDVLDVLDYTGGAKSVAFDDLHRAIAAATRGSVAIYPVNPCGLGSDDGCVGEAAFAALQSTMDLRALADATGGFAVLNTNNVAGGLTRVVRENSFYYLLGFSSTNDRRDGRFRRIEVRTRRPGLTVRTRGGYLGPRDDAVEDVRTSTLPLAVAGALASPVANAAVTLRATAVPYKGPDRRARVAIALEMDAAALGLAERDGVYVGDLAVATTAVAANGDVHPGQRFEAGLELTPASHTRATRAGLRVLSEMDLPVGQYQLRLVGGSPVRAGSVVYDLEVPDFTEGALTMSGVALTAASADDAFTIRQLDSLGGLLPGPLTAAREFTEGDVLTLYTEVYENGRARATHVVALSVELRSTAGRALWSASEERSSAELAGQQGGYGFGVEVPLAVRAGLYVLHVEARANIGDRPSVSRDIVIRVIAPSAQVARRPGR